ncbi:Sorting nexin-21, partial [Operophtera brumata]
MLKSLKCTIVSSRVVDEFENEKKYVAYMVQAKQNQTTDDSNDLPIYDKDPVKVERRYTHFLDLYNGLKKEQPAMLQNITFPRKVAVGNYEPVLISSRCAAFESLLSLIASESRLRDSPAAVAFFQDPELLDAKMLIGCGKFDQALSVLETSFKLLNKVYTDRSRVVLSALCRIVACAGASEGALAGPVERWAQLALKRYEAVSDSDLETLGRDKASLVEELNGLRKRGMKVDSVPTLMDA